MLSCLHSVIWPPAEHQGAMLIPVDVLEGRNKCPAWLVAHTSWLVGAGKHKHPGAPPRIAAWSDALMPSSGRRAG